MVAPKISNFVIALIIISFCAVSFALYLKEYTNYGLDPKESNIEVYNQLDELDTLSKESKETTLNFKENTGVLDVIGNYFSNAYNSLKVTAKSMTVFDTMINTATNNEYLNNPLLIYLKTSLVSIIVIVIIIAVIIAAVVKKDV